MKQRIKIIATFYSFSDLHLTMSFGKRDFFRWCFFPYISQMGILLIRHPPGASTSYLSSSCCSSYSSSSSSAISQFPSSNWKYFLFTNWNIFLFLFGIFSFFYLEYFPFSNWNIFPFWSFISLSFLFSIRSNLIKSDHSL